MPSKLAQEALEKGIITKKQYSNLNENLLDAIVKKKMGSTTKGKARKGQPKGSRLAFDDTKQETHKMSDGTLMTGKKHTSKSKPVKKKKKNKK